MTDETNIIEIRKVTAGDILRLQKISLLTFYETFAAENSEENMKRCLNNN